MIIKRELRERETLRVDTGCIVAMAQRLTMIFNLLVALKMLFLAAKDYSGKPDWPGNHLPAKPSSISLGQTELYLRHAQIGTIRWNRGNWRRNSRWVTGRR